MSFAIFLNAHFSNASLRSCERWVVLQNWAIYYFDNLCLEGCGKEVTFKRRVHENRKKNAKNVSFDELVAWAEEEAQSPPLPKFVSRSQKCKVSYDDVDPSYELDRIPLACKG